MVKLPLGTYLGSAFLSPNLSLTICGGNKKLTQDKENCITTVCHIDTGQRREKTQVQTYIRVEVRSRSSVFEHTCVKLSEGVYEGDEPDAMKNMTLVANYMAT